MNSVEVPLSLPCSPVPWSRSFSLPQIRFSKHVHRPTRYPDNFFKFRLWLYLNTSVVWHTRTNLDKLHSRKCSLSKFSCYVLQFASKHPNKGILCEFVPAKKQQVRRIGYQNWMTYTCHVRYLSAKTHNIEQLVRVTPSKKPHNWCCLVPIVWVFTPF